MGSGGTPATIDEYCLADRIHDGSLTASIVVTTAIENGKVQSKATYTITNSSDEEKNYSRGWYLGSLRFR